MGATNSVPHTASFENPRPGPQIGIHITEQVVNRLEDARKQGTMDDHERSCFATANDIPIPAPPAMQPVPPSQASVPIATVNTVCKNCEIKEQIVKNEESIPSKIDEVHQVAFDQALEKVEKVFAKPEKWQEELSQDIKLQQRKLIECYKSEEKRETFECEKLAKEFQKFVFEKQNNTMKTSESAE